MFDTHSLSFFSLSYFQTHNLSENNITHKTKFFYSFLNTHFNINNYSIIHFLKLKQAQIGPKIVNFEIVYF